MSDYGRFLLAIPAVYREHLDTLAPSDKRRELDRWYWWWVHVGRHQPGSGPQGQLYGEELPPWVAKNPPRLSHGRLRPRRSW